MATADESSEIQLSEGPEQVQENPDADVEKMEEDAQSPEHRIWKKNSPLHYDCLITSNLVWPSLTVEWFTDTIYHDRKKCNKNRMLIGSQADPETKEQDYFAIVDVFFPSDELELPKGTVDVSKYDQHSGEIGGYGRTEAGIDLKEQEVDGETIQRMYMKVYHDGDVNKARHCPHNTNIIATKSGTNSDTFVFDLTRHPLSPSVVTPNPQLTLKGHSKTGVALDWSKPNTGMLASGGDDNTVVVWDLHAADRAQTAVQPKVTFQHDGVVESVCWHWSDPNMLSSAADDSTARFWDIRDSGKAMITLTHPSEVNSICGSKTQPTAFITSCSDNNVYLWDVRKPTQALCTLKFHKQPVYAAQWSPHCETLVATAGVDGRVLLWDLKKATCEPTKEGLPAALMFIHQHQGEVNDIAWNPCSNDPLTIASSAGNHLHVWRMAEHLRTSF
eukprot:TRINITY_DN85166_c0_g1_i1.p1 TRINITY_DN85166_c0_g1~~TRINITY_DN85166_c0_g1_i1.p1  ORF type:complete len:445 (-),score=31.31 TRINITY_DN85166_c0_g1_i1:107-1441(-)